MLVKTLALRSGFDEAVILDPQGFVAECTGENIFMIRRGVIYTPPLATVLEGLTRDTIITFAQDLGLRVEEKLFTRDQLYIADEVFICGTAAEVVSVCKVDHRLVKDGQVGPITRSLINLFADTVHGIGKHSIEWLDLMT
jgi:branched-chain amino acid aminotransferase